MKWQISKSEFKAKALEILATVESTGKAVLVTNRGIPTIEVRPYHGEIRQVKHILRGTVLAFDNPVAPTGVQWKALE